MQNTNYSKKIAFTISQNIKERDYWLKQLSGKFVKTSFPRNIKKKSEIDCQFVKKAVFRFQLEGDLFSRLVHLCNQSDKRLHILLVAGIVALLHKYTDSMDILVGAPVYRQKVQGEPINTVLVLRNRLKEKMTFKELLLQIGQTVLEANKNQNYPFETLLYQLNLPILAEECPLFDVAVLLENIHDRSYLHPVNPGLVFSFLNTGNNIKGKVVYQSLFYDINTIEIIIGHFNLLLQRVVSAINSPLGDINILSAEEKNRILIDFNDNDNNIAISNTTLPYVPYITEEMLNNVEIQNELLPDTSSLIEYDANQNQEHILTEKERRLILNTFNDTKVNYPKDKTLHQLFDQHSEKFIHRAALVYMDQCITYSELNCRANQLACFLHVRGLQADGIVGLLLNRSIEMIISIFAILRAGGAYLPISPMDPKERQIFVLKDSSTEFLLTTKELGKKTGFDKKTIFIDETSSYTGSVYNLENMSRSTDLSYVIYTSGTTGKPKGVLIQHNNVVRLLFNDKFLFNFNSNDVWTMFHSYSFDFSVWEMWGALLYGGKLVIIPRNVARDQDRFLQILIEQTVTVLNQTPSAFYSLANQALESFHPGLKIKYVIFGGEALYPAKLKKWKEKYPTMKLINMYGITETTVHVTYKEILGKEIMINRANIGKPIPTLSTYIMDKNLKLVPPGIPGELCVGGKGLARGYLNRPEMTRIKFVKNPYNPKECIYRSGDLAKLIYIYGDIEYLGRIDHQVKIRGYRIELEEIETVLRKYQGLLETVVVVKGLNKSTINNGDKYLCAYFVANKPIVETDLLQFLSAQLPTYLIPSSFAQLEKIPLTHNGKLNRRLLEVLDLNINRKIKKRKPNNEIEKKMVELWSDILGISKENIGIEDNFFQLGGHSLNITVLAARIHKEFHVNIPLVKIFSEATIKELSQYISGATESKYMSIKTVEKKEYYPLSSAQKRLYAIQQIDPNSIGYNMTEVYLLEGEVKKQKVENAFIQLIKRHESLRTSFVLLEGKSVQRIHKKVAFSIQYDEVVEEKIQEILKTMIKPFELSQAPLLRLMLIKITESKHIVMLDMHHIISDGISNHIFVSDLMSFFEGKILRPKRIQYKDFSQWQNRLIQSGKLKQQESYWLNIYSGEIPLLNLPTDYIRPVVKSFKGSTISFTLDKRESAILKKLVLKEGYTLFMILLSVFSILLAKLSGQVDIIIGTPIGGRRHIDLENIVGIFVNTMALRTNPISEKIANTFLLEVKEHVLHAYENQDYQFEELVQKVALKRDASRNPLFDVVFSHQNIPVKKFEVSNLELKHYPYNPGRTHFDLALYSIELKNSIELTFEYCNKVFKRETIQRFIVYFKRIMTAILQEPGKEISMINIVTDKEKQTLLYRFNDTKVDYPENKTIDRLFAEQVEQTPDLTALVSNEAVMKSAPLSHLLSITYRELYIRSLQLAFCLKEKSITPDTIVAVMIDRSIDMIISLLGILKAGGAYLPINPGLPQKRIDYILKDSVAAAFITTSHLNKEINIQKSLKLDNNLKTFFIEDLQFSDSLSHFLTFSPSHSPTLSLSLPSDLAYITYTSGSTGNAKAVMAEHKNVVRLVKNTTFYTFKQGDRLLKTGALEFDASTFEIWGTLLNGLSLYLYDNKEILQPGKLKDILHQNDIATIWLTSSLFNNLLDKDIEIFSGLRNLLVGGETLSPSHINRLRERFHLINVINGYGPTENVTFSTTFPINREYISNIPIGKPISNSTAYIVDKSLIIQPIGVIGELIVGGDGVTRGYLNNVELTKEKFIDNPFISGKRVYRTGDLSRWLEDGNIEFFGRLDYQVKIRGFRIELGEIESQLRRHENVKEAVAIAVKDTKGDQSIYAYYVENSIKTAESMPPAGEYMERNKGSNDAITPGELKEYLRGELPDYIIPTYIVKLEKIPLLPNGKIDRQTLSKLSTNVAPELELVTPRTTREEMIVNCWKQVLKLDKVGVNNNYFDVGGNSINIISLSVELQKLLGIEISIARLFQYPTVASFVKSLEVEKNNKSNITSGKENFQEIDSRKAQGRLKQRRERRGTRVGRTG